MKIFENETAPKLEITMQGASKHLIKQYNKWVKDCKGKPTKEQAEKFISERGLVKKPGGNYGRYGVRSTSYTWVLYGVAYN